MKTNYKFQKNQPVQYLVADATRQMRRPRQVAKKAKKAANQRTTWLNPNDQSTPSRITLKIASPDARVFNENRRKDSPSEKKTVYCIGRSCYSVQVLATMTFPMICWGPGRALKGNDDTFHKSYSTLCLRPQCWGKFWGRSNTIANHLRVEPGRRPSKVGAHPSKTKRREGNRW